METRKAMYVTSTIADCNADTALCWSYLERKYVGTALVALSVRQAKMNNASKQHWYEVKKSMG